MNDTGAGPVTRSILSDDGRVVRSGFTSLADALSALADMWMAVAHRHGLELASGDLRYVADLNGFTIDGMPADEWIDAVCGCYEVGGTSELHVEA